MAIAWTAVINKSTVFGDERVFFVTLTSPTSGSDTYTTGGDNIAPALVGLDYIDFATADLALPSGQTTGYVVNITPGVGAGVNAKLQLFATGSGSGAALAEVSSATAISAYTIQAIFYGV